MRADRRLYLDVSMSRLVEECDAAFLLVAKGHEIPAADVKRLGLQVWSNGMVMQGPEPVATAKVWMAGPGVDPIVPNAPLADVVLPVEVIEPAKAKAPRKGKQK